MTRVIFLVLAVSCCFISCANCVGLTEKFTWSKINYNRNNKRVSRQVPNIQEPRALIFPEDSDDEDTIPSHFGKDPFVYEKNIPIGANRWKNKLFITVPRRQFGIPSTLNYIHYNGSQSHNVPLIPYPNVEVNGLTSLPGKDNFVSIYRIAIDPCDRLWMVDTGIIEMPGNRTVLKKQRLIIMDLNTDSIVKTYYFKDSDLTEKTTLTMVVLDITKQRCDDAYAYFPDLAGYGLVVYSLKKNTSWRVKHNYFYLEPTAGNLDIAGIKFQWTDGIFSIALTDVQQDGYRTAMFHSLIGNNLYKVSTRILRNETAINSYSTDDFVLIGSKGKNTHSSASDIHKKSGILFFGLVNQNAIACWNTNKPFEKNNIAIVHKDDKKMIYPSDLKIYDDDLIVLTNAMPIFVYSKLNYDETNFRVWTRNVYEAVKGTTCE